MKFKVDKKKKSGILSLEGDLTIQRAADLKKALLNALKSADSCLLNFEQVTSIDLSGIQLLYSACQTASKSNKEISLDGDCPQVLQRAAEDAGYALQNWLCFGE